MDVIMQYMRPELVWFLIGVGMFLIELSAPGIFFMFFGMGAWLTAAVAFGVDISLSAQLIIFLTSSTACLVLLRKRFRGIFGGGTQDVDETLDRYTGEKVLVKEKVSPDRPGKVELHGTVWSAESDSVVEPETLAEVTGRTGLVLKIKPIERRQS